MTPQDPIISKYLSTPQVEGGAALALETLKQSLKGAKRVLLAFGYYDIRTLHSILRSAERRASVSIVLNGLGGPALQEQLDELRLFAKRNRGRRLQVRLYFSNGIFHPKLIVALRNSSRGTAWIGSANATAAAFPEKSVINQELMAEVKGNLEPLIEYFSSVFEDAKCLEDIKVGELRAESLPAFFRTGALAFRPTSQVQVSFSPFTTVIRGLKDKQKKALGAREVRNSEKTTGIGAFNIARAVGLDETHLVESTEGSRKVSPLAFGFETSLGYWIPEANLDSFKRLLEKAESRKRSVWKRLAQRVEETGSAVLRQKYAEYVSDVKDAFADAGLTALFAKTASQRSSDVNGGHAFIDRTIRNLANPGYIDRQCRSFLLSPMPEIWEDVHLTNRFVSSFFEGILGIHLKGAKGARHHVRSVLKACSKHSSDGELLGDADALEAGFRRYLRMDGWNASNWAAPRR